MRSVSALGLGLSLGLSSLTLVGCQGLVSQPPATGGLQNLNHIIIFVQENRSFDHYFGAMREYWAQNGIADQSFDGLPQFNPANGSNPPLYGAPPTNPGCDPALSTATTCVASTSYTVNQVTSFHMASVCNEEQSPFWNEAHVDWDFNDAIGVNPAALNGFVQAAANDARQSSPPLNDINGLRAMGYFDGGDLNYYYFMASNFATSDRWFSPVMSRTQLNRMYLMAATSAGHAYPLAPPYGPLANTTIFQELQNAGITWKIYVNPDGTNCAATDSACLDGFFLHQYVHLRRDHTQRPGAAAKYCPNIAIYDRCAEWNSASDRARRTRLRRRAGRAS